MPYLAPGTEQAVLTTLAAHLREDAFLVVGFGLDRGYSLSDFDTHVAGAGLRLEHRFATWDLRQWRDDSPFAVTVLRVPYGIGAHPSLSMAPRRPAARPSLGPMPRRCRGPGPA